ncbi:IS66 family insertion sequence element accessory protein TnpB [Mesorhizobium sp. L2C084A000]|uniref:IS66 family insertion sequence element accessory protein TnpB n=1 Tax=Mesorhizobium sp. L2C084A000 TaxID=1287116 RepID=UPI0004CF6CB8|nr:IS66 family insertion sequence element accessory protein TnpB [Mesorhizobium sp. L2C084A000]
MALDPFAPAVFAFCKRRRDRMKLLIFDRSGFVLVLKRLTEDRFRWPRREAAVVTLTPSNCTGSSMASTSMRWSAIRCGNIRLSVEGSRIERLTPRHAFDSRI